MMRIHRSLTSGSIMVWITARTTTWPLSTRTPHGACLNRPFRSQALGESFQKCQLTRRWAHPRQFRMRRNVTPGTTLNQLLPCSHRSLPRDVHITIMSSAQVAALAPRPHHITTHVHLHTRWRVVVSKGGRPDKRQPQSHPIRAHSHRYRTDSLPMDPD